MLRTRPSVLPTNIPECDDHQLRRQTNHVDDDDLKPGPFQGLGVETCQTKVEALWLIQMRDDDGKKWLIVSHVEPVLKKLNDGSVQAYR